MTEFKFERQWLKALSSTAADTTLARLRIIVGDQNITAYKEDRFETIEGIEIPLYYLAEWIAENWWPLLWEPRKSDDIEDTNDFLSRHSTLHAQHGFALPRVTFISNGEQINISARSRLAPFADVKFVNSATAAPSRKHFESEMRRFVSDVVARLEACGVSGTDLQSEWSLISDTQEDEVQYCKLVGALGLSPYIPNERLSDILERASENYSDQVLLDLCLTSSPANFIATIELAQRALELTQGAQESTLEPLARTSIPADNPMSPAYRRGVQAAKAVREALLISDTDPNGSTKLFDLLNIDTGTQIALHPNSSQGQDLSDKLDRIDFETAPIVGAVARTDYHPKIGLLQSSRPKRRFTAARGAYLAWTGGTEDANRLITTALTRDQQASRGFAAEIMVPAAYLRKAIKRSGISYDDVFEQAAILGASPDLVRKQAQNNNITLRGER